VLIFTLNACSSLDKMEEFVMKHLSNFPINSVFQAILKHQIGNNKITKKKRKKLKRQPIE